MPLQSFQFPREKHGEYPPSADPLSRWRVDALAMAAQAKVLSGTKLEQLATRIQRHSGQPREARWCLIVQYDIKGKPDYRKWTEPEFEIVRDELVKGSAPLKTDVQS
jgi:hypothetical protein